MSHFIFQHTEVCSISEHFAVKSKAEWFLAVGSSGEMVVSINGALHCYHHKAWTSGVLLHPGAHGKGLSLGCCLLLPAALNYLPKKNVC